MKVAGLAREREAGLVPHHHRFLGVTTMADVYQIITARIVSQLESGTIPWRRPWSPGRQPQNLISRREYRGVNVFLLGSQHFESPYWLTFKQAQELKGHVRKGEHATPVVFWR